MIKIYCDRCGEEIKGISAKMLPAGGKKLSTDELHELLQMKAPLQDKVFCKGCIEEIVNFALNKNICDECVQQMMDENAMIREVYPAVVPVGSGVDLGGPKDGTSFIGHTVLAEEAAKAMKFILEECRRQSGVYMIPLQPIDPELISQYKKMVKKYGVPKQCINIPVSSSGDGSEDI